MILQKGAFEEFFWRGGLDGKGVVNFWKGGPGFLEIAIINFTSQLLFELLFAHRLKDVVGVLGMFQTRGGLRRKGQKK